MSSSVNYLPFESFSTANQLGNQEDNEDNDEGELAEEGIDDQVDENILSLHYANHKIGFVFYSTKTGKLYLFDEYNESPGGSDNFQIVDKIIQQVEPSYVIISNRLESRVKERLKSALNQLSPVIDPANDDSDNQDGANETSFLSNNQAKPPNGPQSMSTSDDTGRRVNQPWLNGSYDEDDLPSSIVVKPSTDFSLDEAQVKLFQLELPNMPQFNTPREKFIYLSTMIKFKDLVTIQALGALIKQIETFHLILEGDGQRIRINGISPCTLERLVFLDNQSKLALQIFATENHPSVYKQGNSRKEGLSLFALFNRCSSKVGRRYLKKLFNQPTNNLDELEARLDMVEFFVNTPSFVDSLRSKLKFVQDTNIIIAKMKYADLTANDWSKLKRTVENIIGASCILMTVQNAFSDAHRFNYLINNSRVNDVVGLIREVVDFKESKSTGRFEVRMGLDKELDEMKDLYRRLPDLMFEKGVEEFLNYQDRIGSCQIIYTTHLGFHLKVPLEPQRLVEKNYKIPGLEYRYHVGEYGFYKSPITRDLDSSIGDILTEIYDRQRQYQLELQLRILDLVEVLDELVEICARLDALMAIAATSRALNYNRPNFDANGYIDIKDGRHPLQEFFVQSYVPNDCQTGDEIGKIQIITGPNASGKSVFLKQVCLIVYLAHIGSFVPAKFANIALFERILTRIKTIESISLGLSSFILDLQQVSLMVREPLQNSLIAIDEFGKGTDEISGVSLLAAIIDYFSSSQHVPNAFISTHFLNIGEYLRQTSYVTYWTLEVALEGDNVNYKHKVVPGKSSSSRAVLAIRAAGLNDAILERTQEIETRLRNKQKMNPRKITNLEIMGQKLCEIYEAFDRTDFDQENFDGGNFLRQIM